MANYTSRPIELTPITSNINFPLIQQVLAVKQSKYDQANQNVKQGISTLENIKVLRPEDQEYIDLKINNLVNDLNGMADKDLSNGSVSDGYYNAIQSVTRDPIVGDAIANTMKYSSFQQSMQKLQEKDPSKVNSVNYQYAVEKAGMNEYLEGKTNKLGEFRYNSYSDYNKNLLDRLKVIKDLKGDQEIQIQGTGDNGIPLGQIQVKKLSGLTAQEIVNYVPGMMTGEDEMQMRIDGWYESKVNPQGVEAQFNTYKSQKVNDFDTEISEQRAIIGNSTNSNDKISEANLKLRALEAQKESFLKNTENTNLELKGYVSKQGEYIKSISEMAASTWSVSYKKDDVYFANEDLRIKARTLALKEAENAGQDNLNITVSPDNSVLQQEVNFADNLIKEHDNRERAVVETVQSVFNLSTIPQSIKNDFTAKMASMGYNTDGTIKDPNRPVKYDRITAMTKAFEESNMNIVDPEASKQLLHQKALADNIAQDYDNTYGTVVQDYFKTAGNIDDFVEELATSTEPTTGFNIFGSVLRPGSVNVSGGRGKLRQFLNKVGSNNIAKILAEDPSKAKEFVNILKDISSIGSLESRSGFRELGRRLIGAPSITNSASEILDSIESRTNQKINEVSRQRGLMSFGTANVVNISNPKMVTSIVNSLDQSQVTNLFDQKKPISVRVRNEGNERKMIIEQNKGITSAGKVIPAAKIEVDSQDPAFLMLNNLIDLNETNRGLDASRSNTTILSNKRPNFIQSTDKPTVGKLSAYLARSVPQSYFENGSLLARPEAYLTKESTRQTYRTGLAGKYSAEEIENIVSNLTANIGNYQLEVSPMDNNWVLNLKTRDNVSIRKGRVGQQYLEPEFIDLVNNYPQTLIMDYFLQNLREDRSNLNQIPR